MRITHTFAMLIPFLFLIGLPLSLDGTEPDDGTTQHLCIAASGSVSGEMTICNCSGGMNGGFLRRGAYLRNLRGETDPVLAIDLGNAFGKPSEQERLKADAIFNAYETLGYGGFCIAEQDLGLGVDCLLEIAKRHKINLVSATIARADSGELLAQPYVIHTVRCGGRDVRVGILGMCGKKPARKGSPLTPEVYEQNGLTLIPIADAARKYIPQLREKADVIVVAGQLMNDDIIAITESYPDVAVILSGRSQARREPKLAKDSGVAIYHSRGAVKMVTIRTDIALKPTGGIESVKISERLLGPDVPDDPSMLGVVEEYVAKLDSLPPPAISGDADPEHTYVGASKCGECHAEQMKVWQESGHAKAIFTLAKTSQTKDHDCLSCHTTGYLKPTGFRDVDLTADRANVQCETCHGPGAEHARNPRKGYGAGATAVCTTCHTSEKDTDWNLDRCLAIIRH